jgi:iron(III) transport system permease protein
MSAPGSRHKLLRAAILAVYLGFVFGPLLALAGKVVAGGSADYAAWRLVMPSDRRLGLLIHSLSLAGAVALGGTFVGGLAGLALWRLHSGIASYLRWGVLILAPVPAYIHALAWSSFMRWLGAGFETLGFGGLALEGWVGSWWVETMAYLPLATGLCLMGLEMVIPELVEAARVMRSDFDTLMRIVLPLAAPAFCAAAGLLFVISLTDYSVPSLFSVSVYSLEIFAEYSIAHRAANALFLSVPLLFVTAVVVVLLGSALRNAATAPRRAGREQAPMAWPGWLAGLCGMAMIIVVAQVLVPGISLAVSTGSWRGLARTVSLAAREISFTAWIGAVSAAVCLPLAFGAAAELLRPGWRGRLWWLLVTLPLAVPAPLMGIGLIAFWNGLPVPGLYGTDWMPVLAALGRFTPPAALVALIALRRMDPLLADAARVHQHHPVQRLVQVQIPMLAPGLMATAGLAFALALGELGATLLITPPGRSTLAIRIYNYLHYGASGSVAGLCLMMAGASILAASLALAALAVWHGLCFGPPGADDSGSRH